MKTIYHVWINIVVIRIRKLFSVIIYQSVQQKGVKSWREMSEGQGLISDGRPAPPAAKSQALYHDSTQGPVAKTMQLLFISMIVIMVLVTLFLSVYKGIDTHSSDYFLLGINLLGFIIIEVLMIIFTRRGDLPRRSIGFCILLDFVYF